MLIMKHMVTGILLAAVAAVLPSSESAFRFMSFNIWGDYFGNPARERDVDEAQIVRRANPDVVAFQEVTSGFWESRLFPSLTNEFEVVGRKMGRDGGDSFTPLLYRRSRFDLVEAGSDVFCPELDGSKGTVWAVLRDRVSGKKLAVFASHFWWRYDGPGDDWVRLENARRLEMRMRELARKHGAALIGGGDLNASLDSWAMRHLVGKGLADAQTTAAESPRDFPTEHGDPVRDATGKYVGVNGKQGVDRVKPQFRYLDHIFYDPTRISVRRFSLDISPEACAVSDHHPILADFTVR